MREAYQTENQTYLIAIVERVKHYHALLFTLQCIWIHQSSCFKHIHGNNKVEAQDLIVSKVTKQQ